VGATGDGEVVSDITMTFDVEGTDPTLEDPHDVAGVILDTFNEWARANGTPEVAQGHLEAEWVT
jgi:hypothetical protein